MNLATRALLAASLASALTVPVMAAKAGSKKEAKAEGSSEVVHCYGVNKCKGVGDCGGPGHSCKGQNTCKHQAFVDMEKDICLKLDGGRLTAKAE